MEQTSMYQHRPVADIIGREETDSLQTEIMDMIANGGSYEEVEDIMLGYGLEMNYLEDILF